MEKRSRGLTGQRHTNRRHEIAGVACEYLIKAILIDKGFIVSTPDISTGYDFITDWGDGLINRVQVRSTKSSQSITGSKRTRFRVRSIRRLGNYSVLIIHIQPQKTSYIIPWCCLKDATISFTVGLKSKYDEFQEAWHLLKEVH